MQQLQGTVKKIYIAHIDNNTWRVLLYGKAPGMISVKLALLRYFDYPTEAEAEAAAKAQAVCYELTTVYTWSDEEE